MKKCYKIFISSLIFSVYIPVVTAIGFLWGWMVGGGIDFTWFCLSNGCGYEATAVVGFWVGLVIGMVTLPVVIFYRKKIAGIFE